MATLGDGTSLRSSPGQAASTPPLKKYVTCAYFSVSATWNCVQPASLKAWASDRASSGPKATSDRQADLVLAHRDDEEVRRAPARPAGLVRSKRVERGLGQRVGELPGAVGAEVDVDDRVAVPQRAVRAVDHGRARRTRRSRRGRRPPRSPRWRRRRGAPRRGRSRRSRAPCAPSACRGPSRSSGRRPSDARVGVDRRQARLEVAHEPERGAGRRVAAVEQRVDPHGRHAQARGQLHERDEVPVVGMDAARAR